MELERARMKYAEATMRITCDYVDGVTERDRVLLRGRTLDIGWVNNVDEMDVHTELLCSEVR